MPGQYFLVFLTFPAWRNSFQGALPPTVGWSFLLTGSSLPEADGLASTAIWANCRVSNDDGNLPTSSSPLASSTHFSASSPPLLWVRASWLGMGDELERGPPSFLCQSSSHFSGVENPPLPTSFIFLWHHFGSHHTVKQ